MNKKFYPTLAFGNIKRNKQAYLPYILTCIFTIIIFYIVHTISINEGLNQIRGGYQLTIMLSLGTTIIAIFSAVFLFYTNSFLIKQRKKELGLYNILGMSKKHIAKMMVFETTFTSVISLILGILGGIILSKLMFLILLKLLGFAVPIKFNIPISSIYTTLNLFVCIFAITLVFNLIQVHISNPIELLKGENIGEREPKTKWILVIVSVITLGIGYTIAIVVERPSSALGGLFIAVILVMIGTYSLFAAGSIAILKMLKRNKNLYYTIKYFVPVSSMIYRMKQNAIGLANICILSTAVLVTLSATLSLYLGEEDILRKRYPKDISIVCNTPSDENYNLINETVNKQLKIYNMASKDLLKYTCSKFFAAADENNFYLSQSADTYCMIYLLYLDEYNKIENKSISLNDDEILIFSDDKNYEYDEFNIFNKKFKVKQKLENLKLKDREEFPQIDYYYIILNDINFIIENVNDISDTAKLYYKFDLDSEDKSIKNDFASTLSEKLNRNAENAYINKDPYIKVESLDQNRQEFLAVFGGFLFIGILIGTLFLIATALIIYYKQISEGIEDKHNFEIMQKVGMNKKEIKHSIQSQIILIFFLPLIIAIIHMAFAFKIISKLLMAFNFYNTPLFIVCTIITILAFTLIYFVVYMLTAKVYYKIVK